MRLAAGLLLALVSTAALTYGFYLQHSASGTLPALSLRRPLASLSALFTSRRWLAGFIGGLAGWGLYIVALDLAPISLVQATSAGGVGLLALLVQAGGTHLPTRDKAAAAVSVAGLLLLGLSLTAGTSHAVTVSWRLPCGWILVSVLAAAVAAGPARALLRPGAGLAAAAGLLYAAGDVATKAAVSGIAPVLIFALLLPACHGIAFVCVQMAFQRGTALATAGLSTLLTNLLPILAGLTVFAEHMPGGLPGMLRGAGFAGAVIGAALLARPGLSDEGGLPDAGQSPSGRQPAGGPASAGPPLSQPAARSPAQRRHPTVRVRARWASGRGRHGRSMSPASRVLRG
jgi:hypothetical protein